MKGFLTTHKGMEDIAALEVYEITGKKANVSDGCVVFDIKSYEDLFKLCYLSQSAIGVHHLLSEYDSKNIFEDFKQNLQKIDFNGWLSENIAFRVSCIKNTDGNMPTPELEKEFGALAIEHIKNRRKYAQKVSLNNPGLIISVLITNSKCYIGIDFCGFDLSKRNYNIFAHPAGIKGTIAYSLVRLSGYNPDERLLDCFSASGTISIEASLFASHFPVNFYNKDKFAFLRIQKFKNFDFNEFFKNIDSKINAKKLNICNVGSSMKYINYAKKNSKIAGITKKITFSRMDLGWLDTKFDKGEINKIVVKMPYGQEDMGAIYNEFFYQAEFILNTKGKIALIGKKDLVEKHSSKYNFKVISERNISSGKEQYNIFALAKGL